MKIIFLDHDGVICYPPKWGTRYKKQNQFVELNPYFKNKRALDMPPEIRFDDFNPEAVDILNEILKESDAEIIVSSDWNRQATLAELQDLYHTRGIIKKPVGITRKYDYEDFKKRGYDVMQPKMDRNYSQDLKRVLEIRAFMQEVPGISKWVAVDDMLLGSYWWDEDGLENFVHTTYTLGLTQKGVKEEILSYLE